MTLNTSEGIFQSLFPIKVNNKDKTTMRKSINKFETVTPVSSVVDALPETEPKQTSLSADIIISI